MAAPMKTAIPLGLDIADGYILRFNAIDASSGANITGVVVSDVTVQADVLTPADESAPTPELSPVTGAYTEGGPAV